MRDRLRALECPPEIMDQIGGWRTGGVGPGYGNGYPLGILSKWMKRCVVEEFDGSSYLEAQTESEIQ